MARLYLVRHGRALAGYGDADDPGLDDVGRTQADAAADRLAPIGPIAMITSPMQRARETAAALERRWNTMAIVEPGVGEITAPTEDLVERRAWVGDALTKTWSQLGPRYTSWRTMVSGLCLSLRDDTVVFTHFFGINAVIGVATGDDRVLCRSVANGSITVVDADGHDLTLVELGEQDATVVQ